MAKLSLNNLASMENDTTVMGVINTNNDATEAAMEKTLSRDGTSPNEMNATLDMNSNRIINLPVPVASSEPLRKGDFDGFQDFVVNAANLSDTVQDAVDAAATATTQAAAAQDIYDDMVTVIATRGDILCTPSGTQVTLTLTPVAGQPTFSSLTDGMRFRFKPEYSWDVYKANWAVPSIRIAYPSGGYSSYLSVYKPGGGGLALFHEVQKGVICTIEYNSTLAGFVLKDNYLSFAGSVFANGKCKLQSSGSTTLGLDHNDGNGLLVWNPTTLTFVLSDFTSLSANNLFGTVNMVEGVANQALATNQLYSVYVYMPSGTDDRTLAFDFYRTYTGVGTAAWNPTTNEFGLYVKPATLGGTAPDNTRTYVGMLYSGAGDIGISLTGTSLKSLVQSHYNPWQFDMVNDQATETGFTTTSATAVSGISSKVVTEGVEGTPHFVARANATCTSGAGQTAYLRLKWTHLAFNGVTTYQYTPWSKATCYAANAWVNLNADLGFACAMGLATVVPEIMVSSGTWNFEVDMTTKFVT